jgi:hypothetical protein
MVLGTVAIGDECAIDQDCAGDAYCATDGACPGACAEQLLEDEACTDSDDDQCEDGLICASATDTCVALSTSAQSCGAGMAACEPGTVCVDRGSGAQCTAVGVVYFRGLDEACSPGTGSCDPGVALCGDPELCEPGLVCESATSGGVCRPTVEAGAACKRAVPNQCPASQVCDAAAPGETGSCVDRPGAGQDCISRPPPCAAGHACVENVCRALQDEGEACSADGECWSGTCSASGSCEDPAICEIVP